MSVYRPSPRHKTYVYDFEFNGARHKDSTKQRTEQAALLVEAKKKLELRTQAGGIAPVSVDDTPTFSLWANVTLKYQKRFITRPAILERTLRMVLAFWGGPPAKPIGPAAVARVEVAPRPYHDLRLGDVVADPSWLEKFEAWMEARGVGGSTRNSYLSACSDLYACAMQPEYRATTGIDRNPFAGIRRSPTRTRTIALTVEQILELIDGAGRHIAHALCVAALAPKLRVATILALQWGEHVDRDLKTITITAHKTSHHSGLAQVVPVSAQLRGILTDIRAEQVAAAATRRTLPSRYVVTWRGRPVKSIKTGLRRAVERTGLPWGLRDGVTFHVMRHSVATILADPELVGALTERLRADVMGHREIRTTQKYTHLNTTVQVGPHESISAALPGLRASLAAKNSAEKVGGKVGGPPGENSGKSQQKRVVNFVRPPANKQA